MSQLVLFEQKQVRRVWHGEAWWFVITDVVSALTDSAVRDELTDEWKKRGVKEDREYAILTAEISKATFGMTPYQYREHKALAEPTDNLRDHMTDLELIFTMLGEASTTEIDDLGQPDEIKPVFAGFQKYLYVDTAA